MADRDKEREICLRTEEKMEKKTEKIKRFLETPRGRLALSVLINLAVMIFMACAMRPFWDTNDDPTMANFVNGFRGETDIHLVFSHLILGAILKVLYSITAAFSWYAVLMYLTIFLSLTGITYVMLERLGNVSGSVLALFLLIYYGYEGYVRMQFTKTAGIATAAGMFLLFQAIDSERVRVKMLIMGLLIGSFGYMYRYQQFWPCAALTTGIGISMLFTWGSRGKEQFWKIFRRLVFAGGGMLLTVFVLKGITSVSYGSQEWKDYLRFNKARALVLDFKGIPRYAENEDRYRELGIDISAYKMLVGYEYTDPEVFSTETLEGLLSWYPKIDYINKPLLKAFLTKFPLGYLGVRTFWCFLAFVILWLIGKKRTKWDFVTLLYEIFWFGLIYYYLFARGRYLLTRVDVGLWISISLVIIWMNEKSSVIKSLVVAALCFAVMVIREGSGFSPVWRWTGQSDYFAGRAADNHRILTEVLTDQDPEHLYLVMRNAFSEDDAYEPFDGQEVGLLNNVLWMGGWSNYGPIWKKITGRYGVTNPYRDMIDNEQIYLVDCFIEDTLEYLRYYYNPDVEATLVREAAGIPIYQITTD